MFTASRYSHTQPAQIGKPHTHYLVPQIKPAGFSEENVFKKLSIEHNNKKFPKDFL